MGTRKNRICIAGGLNILTVKSVDKDGQTTQVLCGEHSLERDPGKRPYT